MAVRFFICGVVQHLRKGRKRWHSNFFLQIIALKCTSADSEQMQHYLYLVPGG